MTTQAERKEALRAALTYITNARSYLHLQVATWEGDGTAEADEMTTRVDDDVVGALIDLEGTCARILSDY